MTEYYLLFRNDTEADCDKETNHLGRVNVNHNIQITSGRNKLINKETIFEKDRGFDILSAMISNNSDLSEVRIFDSNGKKMSIEEFFTIALQYKII